MSSREILNIGTVAQDRTGDTPRNSATKINNNFGSIFNFLGGDSDVLGQNISLDSNSVIFTSQNGAITKLYTINTSGSDSIKLPEGSGTVTLDSTPSTLSNKTISNSILNNIQIADSNADHYYNIIPSELSADQNVRLPVLSDSDEIVMLKAGQILSSKTLNSARLNSPRMFSKVDDIYGAEYFNVTTITDAVNHMGFFNAAIGDNPGFFTAGVDSHISIDLSGKGKGGILVDKFATPADVINTSSTISESGKSYVRFNSGSAISITVPDGYLDGEIKYLSNSGAGTVTITPTNFGNGTSFELVNNIACSLIWDTTQWIVLSNQDQLTIT